MDRFTGAEGWGDDAVGGVFGEDPSHSGIVEHFGVTVDATGDLYGGGGAGAGGFDGAEGGHDGGLLVGDHVADILGEGEAGGEAEVFGDAAEQVGGQVGVAVDEAGKDCLAGTVYDFSVGVHGADLGGSGKGDDAVVLDGDSGVVKDGAAGVAGDDGGVFDDLG